SELGCTEQAPVETTPQPPAAFIARNAARTLGLAFVMPDACGTWKNRLGASLGPMRTGWNRASYRGLRAMADHLLNCRIISCVPPPVKPPEAGSARPAGQVSRRQHRPCTVAEADAIALAPGLPPHRHAVAVLEKTARLAAGDGQRLLSAPAQFKQAAAVPALGSRYRAGPQ